MQVKTRTIVNIDVLTPMEGHHLKENGGTLECSSSWVYRILKRMRLSYRKATTAAQKLPLGWQHQVKLTALRCAAMQTCAHF